MSSIESGGGAAQTPSPDRARPRLLVVEAPWCAECRRMAPLIDTVATEHRGVEVERIDAAADPDRARSLGVVGTPTLIGQIEGSEVTRVTGRRGRAELEALFAGLEAGAVPGRTRRPSTEVAVRAGAGALIAGIGAVTGPAWVLVAAGAALAVYGLSGMIGRR